MPSSRYPVPAHTCCRQIEINRSRFIAVVAPVSSPDAAQALVNERRLEHPAANHHCWAYLLGPPGHSDRIGFSDDGEPHGVAGKPLLTTLLHSDLGDLAIVVSRYFGGIKLGKGGMVKAYTRAAQTVLEETPVTDKIVWCRLTLVFDYPFVEPVRRALPAYQAKVVAEQFSERVTLQLQVPEDRRSGLRNQLFDLCAGQLDWQEETSSSG